MDGINTIADLGFRVSDYGGEANPPSVIRHPQSVARSDEQKQQIARDFESVLITRLFEQVQQSTASWGLEEEDGASQQVQGLFWLFLARDVADKGGFGLWKDIYRQLQQMEGAGGPGAAIDEEL
jgi:Rod binding domain-containing protein